MTPASVKVQIVPESVPSTPSWLAEAVIIAHVFDQFELIRAITERVRFARARFGTYDVIDFVVVLLGYAVSGERTIEDFYERLLPFGTTFMALFGREKLPSDSALSRFLAALDEPAVEALRTLFQEDLVARPPLSPGGLRDRQGKRWLVTDVDGTRAVARQRALPHTPDLPPPHRRMGLVCAPGYPGRKRGEVVRTRTTVLQAHTQNWLGTFGGVGNGDYRGELLRAIQVITSYAQALSLPLSHILIRLDGLYGNAAPLTDLLLSGVGVVVRGKDYHLLDLPEVQARLAQPPDERITHPESGTNRALFDCPDVPLTPAGPRVRMIIAIHPASSSPAPIGITRDHLVYEIFFTTVPPQAFTPADVLDLYLHRGSFETVLAYEDQEQNPDRWVSHTPWGQEFWQILSQWVWNIRLELGQKLSPTPMRLTEFAPARVVGATPVQVVESQVPLQTVESPQALAPAPATSPVSYGPPQFARPSYTGGFAGSAFSLQPDGTLRCPADHPLYPQERRLERNGCLRLLYAARIGHCRPCPLRERCQGHGSNTIKPRRVSAVFRPISSSPSAAIESVPAPMEPASAIVESVPAATQFPSVPINPEAALVEPASATVESVPTAAQTPPAGVASVSPPIPCPVLWEDWPARSIRQRWLKLLRTETVHLTGGTAQTDKQTDVPEQGVLTRAQRAHWRLSWSQRLARNARGTAAPPLEITLHGLPASFAQAVAIDVAA
jgi:hypothetical protein